LPHVTPPWRLLEIAAAPVYVLLIVKSRKAIVFVVATILMFSAAAGILILRRNASLRTLYELDTRLWYLKLKLHGEVPQVTWAEALRRVGPEWPHRERFDVVREIGSGTAPCPVLWQTPLGKFWGTEKDGRELDLLTLEQAVGDIYEQGAVSVRDSDVVLDVGAHLGTFSRIALQRGARLVVAIEPDPVNATCFRRTFEEEIANGRVRLVQAAAWHSSGSLQFEIGNASQTGHVTGAESRSTVTVRAVTLDDMVDELKLDRVDFIKMDIEGAERHALAGARELLAARKPRLAICIYHAPDDPVAVPRVIQEANAGYQTFTRHGFQAYFY
jgi:FkbM family methyltransferase